MSNHMKDWESMNAQSSMTPSARTMQTYRKLKWKEINWKQAELYVNRLQVRIVKAVQADKWRLVKRLQKLITNSFYAKALAVKRVITNKGKNTPGIDGDIWSTDEVLSGKLNDVPSGRLFRADFGFLQMCQSL